MAENKDYVYSGIITLLLLFTGYSYVPDGASTHVCIDNDNVVKEGSFVRLSKTKLTAYPNTDNNKGYKRCMTKWIEIDRVSENNDNDNNNKVKNGKNQICYPEPRGCE